MSTDDIIRLLFAVVIAALLISPIFDKWLFGNTMSESGREAYGDIIFFILGAIFNQIRKNEN